jgi:hypothetical protein
MDTAELVADRQVFSLLRGECEKIIDTQRRLPDFVFRRPFAKYFAIEYAHIYGGGAYGEQFVSFLSMLSHTFHDDSVNYMVIDPEPGDTYYEQTSSFGVVSFKPASLAGRYPLVMNPTKGISRILAGANLGALWGSSLKWGIFADRISWELGVIAVPENVDVPTISGLRCLNAKQVASYITSQYHWKKSVADDFNKRFFPKYPI